MKAFKCRACGQEQTDRYANAGNICKPCYYDYNMMMKKRRHPLCQHLANAKQRAKRMGREFSITLDDLPLPDRCPVLGLPLRYHSAVRGPDSPSIDRIDSSQGYVPGNVWVISLRANLIKNDATLGELRALVDALEGRDILVKSLSGVG